MKCIYIICLLLLLSCTSKKTEIFEKAKESIKKERQNELLEFLNNKKYKYSVSKLDIPSIVIDSISSFNKEPFRIGDSTDTEKINLGCVRFGGEDEYTKELRFVLTSDTACLIVYRTGGRGTHDVIAYIEYKGDYTYKRYTTLEHIRDTSKLRDFLQDIPFTSSLDTLLLYSE